MIGVAAKVSNSISKSGEDEKIVVVEYKHKKSRDFNMDICPLRKSKSDMPC